jgi:hypothetical protein
VVNVTPSVTTIYTLSATNAQGCKSTATQTIVVGQFPNLNISSTSSSLCPGYSATLIASGAEGYTWVVNSSTLATSNPTIVGGPGSYLVHGSNGGNCVDSTSINITALPPLNIQVTPGSSATCIQQDGSINPVTLSASGASFYSWTPYLQGNMTFSLGPNTSVTPSVTTCFTVTGTTTACSGSAIASVTSGYCSGIDEFTGKHLQVYPNPVQQELTVLNLNGTANLIELRDFLGKTVFVSNNFQQQAEAIKIDLTRLHPGVYLLYVSGDGAAVSPIKLVKE